MAKNKAQKEFNFKLYAVVVFFAILVTLVTIVYVTFTLRYTAFHPQEVARVYVDTIVQTGDGYNAYKNSLLSKSRKYGDFIREYYMYPVIDRDVNEELDPVSDMSLPKGYNNDFYKGEKTINDDGSLQGQLIDKMYPFYEKLISENGWDNYDLIFTKYFEKLVEERKAIFGDDYMSDEIMFTALESNVRTYGETLTGTEDAFDENTGIQTSFAATGKYQTAYGEDYKLVVKTIAEETLDAEIYKSAIDTELFKTYGIEANDIEEVKNLTVGVFNADGNKLVETDVVAVRIGRSWYVDNSQTDTVALYSFYN